MGSIEKRGENTWRVGFRRSVADGRGWVRKTLSFPADMPEVEQRKACEVELARLVVPPTAPEGVQLPVPRPGPSASRNAVAVGLTLTKPPESAALASTDRHGDGASARRPMPHG